MFLGRPSGRANELEVGLDHGRSPKGDRRVSFVVEPASQLVSLGWDRPLDPLQTAYGRVGRAREDEAPAREAPLLRLGIEQRERERPARQDRRQAPATMLGNDPDRPVAVGGLDDPQLAQGGRRSRPRVLYADP